MTHLNTIMMLEHFNHGGCMSIVGSETDVVLVSIQQIGLS